MCDRGDVESYPLSLAKLRHLSHSKISAIISDDAMRIAVPKDDLLQEASGSRTVALGDWFNFNPLCELIDCDQEMCETSTGSLERSNHIQPPDRKRPSEGDGIQC
jgi:hypothetical protein